MPDSLPPQPELPPAEWTIDLAIVRRSSSVRRSPRTGARGSAKPMSKARWSSALHPSLSLFGHCGALVFVLALFYMDEVIRSNLVASNFGALRRLRVAALGLNSLERPPNEKKRTSGGSPAPKVPGRLRS
jgi:hypothetical protein